LLNDLYGIQSRGGCSCAGSYGHFLLNIDPETSKKISATIDEGCLMGKMGWVRTSFHPTTTNEEIYYISDALKYISENIYNLEKQYFYIPDTNEFNHNNANTKDYETIKKWFII
jgi:hypothetical protein